MLEALSIIARALLAEFLVACLLFASYSLGRRLTLGDSLRERYCALYLCACWLLTVGFHLLIGVGQFNLVGACVLALVGCLLTWRFGASPGEIAQAIGSDLAELRTSVARSWRTPFAIAATPFVLFAVVLLARVMVLPLLGWDTLTYHGVKAGLWVQQGTWDLYHAPGGWEYYRDCLPGGEIFTAWAMLPFHSDLAAGLPDFVHWLFLGLVLYALARELGLSPRGALPAVCFLLAIPAQSGVVGSGYVDVAMNAQVLAALLFAMKFFRTRRAEDLLLSLCGLGLAVEVKPMAFFWVALLAVVFVVWLALNRAGRSLGWRTALGCCAAFFSPFVPTLVSNALTCGYPLGSYPVAIGSLQLGFLSPSMEWMIDYCNGWCRDVQLTPYNLRSEWTILNLMFAPLTRASVVTCLVGVVALFLLAKKQPWAVILVLVGVVATCLNVYNPSFTPVRMFWPDKSGRFLVPGVVLLTILGAALLMPRKPYGRAYEIFLLASGYLCIALYVRSFLRPAPSLEIGSVVVVATLLVVVAIVVLRYFDPRRQHAPWPTLGVLAIVLACVMPCVQAGRDRLRVVAFAESTVFHDFLRNWTPAISCLAEYSGKKVIAVTVGPTPIAHYAFVYPFLGSRLENPVCYVSPTRTGQIVPQHPRYDNDAALDFPAWLRRLQERGVTHIISFAPQSAELPWMEAHGEHFERLAGDQATWGFYRLK